MNIQVLYWVGHHPIDKALASGNMHGVEIIRYILRCSPSSVLNAEQTQLLRDINWGLRREAMLISLKGDASKHLMAHLYGALYGVWRNVVSYL